MIKGIKKVDTNLLSTDRLLAQLHAEKKLIVTSSYLSLNSIIRLSVFST